jgi:phage terminase large subunit-like protein
MTAVSSGPHFTKFCGTHCNHTQLVEGGPPPGSPFALEPFQSEFWDEALELDPSTGRRVYSRVGMVRPRKNGKTTELAAFSLYTGGPWDGERRPTVILAGGSKEQAGELRDQAAAFIEDPVAGSQRLRSKFVVQKIAITCPENGGVIRRVAGDGKLNHSLNPHIVAADELHAWQTPRQRENWKALTTAQGARTDPMVAFITTEGEGDDDELFDLMERIRSSVGTEIEKRHRCLTIYRNRRAGMLVYVYAAPPGTDLDDVETIKLANPASWRTLERLAKDLADPLVDENTKRRLYLCQRTSSALQWIDDDAWEACRRPNLKIPRNGLITLGVDAARTRDTTALVWSWMARDGRTVVQRGRVWTCTEGRVEAGLAHVFVPGGRLDNDLVRDFIRTRLLPDYNCRLLFFDERYFDTQANDLSKDGMTVVEMHQGKPEMQAAWDEYYAAVYGGPSPAIAHDGDRVFDQHRRKALGSKTERGWHVSKKRGDVIDELAAAVMSRYGCLHFGQWKPVSRRAVSW